MNSGSRIISSILRHDSKQTSYKIALVRAINDLALSYPDLGIGSRDVALPLRQIAEFWLAYYWPFMSSSSPVLQGVRSSRHEVLRQDLAFRPSLTALRDAWESFYSDSSPADGFALIQDLKLSRQRLSYPSTLARLYSQTLREITKAVKQPAQYAGGSASGTWSVFDQPRKLSDLYNVTAVPGSRSEDVCLVIKHDLWQSFQQLSVWVEALCIHEWCLFTEGVDQRDGTRMKRGDIYGLLTERPQNRRPLTWERNQIDILMLEGYRFSCPWSLKRLTSEHYALDHIVPVSVYPMNDLWNLVPSDPWTNSHLKRARLPKEARWQGAVPTLHHTYRGYLGNAVLGATLTHDVNRRFSRLQSGYSPEALTMSVGEFLKAVAEARNLATF